MKNLFYFIGLILVFCPVLGADTPTAADLAGQLRLQRVAMKPFHIEFRGYEELNGEMLFKLYLKDVPAMSQPHLLKKGNALGSGGWIVGDFHRTFEDRSHSSLYDGPATVDKSTLDIVNPDTGTNITVSFLGTFDSPLPVATFVQTRVVGSDTTVTLGDMFSIPGTPQLKFVFFRLTDQGAVIRSLGDNKEFTIQKSDTFESK